MEGDVPNNKYKPPSPVSLDATKTSDVGEGETPKAGTASNLNVLTMSDLNHPLVATSIDGTTEGAGGSDPLNPNTKPPLMPKPRVYSKHDRKVSWGDEYDGQPQTPPQSMEYASFSDNVSHLSSPGGVYGGQSPVPTKGLSLKSLMNQTPYESEAEAYIQRTLDEVDPTRGAQAGPSEAQQTILGGVPEEASVAVFTSDDSTSTTSRSRKKTGGLPLVSPGAHRKTKSTAEDLFDITASLTRMQSGRQSSFLRSTEETENAGDHQPVSNTDALVMNAAQILKQRAGKAAGGEPGDGAAATGTPAPSSAADRWKTLRQHVQATSVVDAMSSNNKTTDVASSKKTDEPSVIDEVVETSEDDVESGESGSDEDRQGTTRKKRLRMSQAVMRRAAHKTGYKDFEEWLSFSKMNAFTYVKYVLCLLIIPCTGVAAILFYLADNPPCGNKEECLYKQNKYPPINPETNTTMDAARFFDGTSSDSASVSWWLLFIGARQVITLTLAMMTAAFLIDFLCLRTKAFVRVFGPFVTLFLVQSKGWPIILFWWGIYDLIMLYGSNRFVKHWLFWQDKIDLFNENNPAGTVLESGQYGTLLIIAVVLGFVVACKRFWVGLYFGRQSFGRFADDLAKVMKKALLIGEVASLSREIEDYKIHLSDLGLDPEIYNADEEGSIGGNTTRSIGILGDLDLNTSETLKINELLGEWEEPEMPNEKDERPPISDIIQFRQSLAYLNTSFPFSAAFGPAGNRKECIESSEKVYARLLLSTPGRSCLKFDTIALAAVGRSKTLDESKVKELIRLFRPDREGNLTLLDFAKSIDSCYKELRLLRASVASNSRMDRTFERIINIVFYFVVILIVVAAAGADPFVLFASISGFIVGFAFAIGPACSKYLEGVLLILVRQPYDIGDRINVSDPEKDTPGTGSAGWIVKDVTLFATTVVFGITNEYATYSNGSLASSRIINHARSPKASLHFLLKFPINAPYKKLQVFKNAIEEFVKDRPRQWTSFSAFRATRVEADQGFVEYIVIAQHRESWQEIGSLVTSKAELSSFALELSKKMNMRYIAPPMPVDLTMTQRDTTASARDRGLTEDTTTTFDIGSVAAMFGSTKEGDDGDDGDDH